MSHPTISGPTCTLCFEENREIEMKPVGGLYHVANPSNPDGHGEARALDGWECEHCGNIIETEPCLIDSL